MDGIIDVDWHDPQSLKRAAMQYQQRAAAMTDQMRRYERFKPPAPEPMAAEHDPYDTSFARLMNQPIEEPRAETECERQEKYRRAEYEIMRALEEERLQAEQQRQQAESDRRQQLGRTGIGQLLARAR